jgi:ATP-dependent Lhr-like helicase
MVKSNISFHPIIKEWFEATFNNLSPPQTKGWPQIAKGNHTLIFAPTGSGKTLAAFMWCINDLFQKGLKSDLNIFDQNLSGVHTLYISPLKALNNDIQRNLEVPLKGIQTFAAEEGIENPTIRTLVRTGDTPQYMRQKMLKKPPHILITTPESLYLLITSLQGREIFRYLKYLIVDEIHSLLTNKRGVHLSLSLERLVHLCQSEPVRIGLSATQKPLQRVADYLGGQINSQKRQVSIVDCGMKKEMDLKVISPLPAYDDLPESSIWPAVYSTLSKLINEHKTTLVFVNMRAQTEKIARKLNEIHQEKSGKENENIAFAHHGSMSRETRFEIEEKLKNGEIPSVIATASLELGIDIGSIDLVVNLESPGSVSGGLQRVGRSGHLLSAKSKGRIIPLYRSDLDDALAIAKAMKDGDIEEAKIPENCLDVLSQQIVAEVSMQSWNRKELYNLFCSSYCYRQLSETVFNQVLEMLAGKYADSKLPNLQSRITWDKVNDKLLARKGARLTSVINGGTIPDRGYYGVYLIGKNVRLGEMEEEFVFESRVGDIFFLGNNEWLINAIKQDRIEVTPVTDIKPRAPFWKGEIPFRDFYTSKIIGNFHEELLNQIDAANSEKWLKENYFADSAISKSLISYYKKQKELTHSVPTNYNVVVEIFRDTAEELNVVFHTTFGAKVNAPWAIVLSSKLEQQLNCEVQYSFDDNGFLMRFLETVEEPPIKKLLKLSPNEVEQSLIESLVSTPLFAIQFRYNAARALLLPRSQPGKRIPLWLQRLRAADLLQAVEKYHDFPIIIETYRSCLQDVFDLTSLLNVINDIHKNKIKINIVNTPYPSPMASGLIFNFLSNQVYEQDRSRIAGDAASISNKFLTDILNKEDIPSVITQEIIDKKLLQWQFLTEERKASNKEDIFEIIEKLGPITDAELAKRSKSDSIVWIKELVNENRVIKLSDNFNGWIIQSYKKYYSNHKNLINTKFLIKKFIENIGPFNTQLIKEIFGFPINTINEVLDEFIKTEFCVYGKLIQNIDKSYWCEKNNFSELYRAAIGARRKSVVAVERNTYYKYLLKWHLFNTKLISVSDIVKRYRGYFFSENVFSREILRSRINVNQIANNLMEFERLISQGDIIVKATKNGNREYSFYHRGEGNIFDTPKIEINEKDKNINLIYNFLKQNGASFFNDIVEGIQLSVHQVLNSLIKLTDDGIITCDNFSSLNSILPSTNQQNKVSDALISLQTRRSKPSRSQIKSRISKSMDLKKGRWFLMESFAVQGKKISEVEKIEKQTRLLLWRYGILVKEMYRMEKGFLPWYQIFQCLKRFEWQGEIRRGYFIEGLSGIQFALPEAIEILEEISTIKNTIDKVNMVCLTDPALPFGAQLKWNLFDKDNNEIKTTRLDSNHLIFFNDSPIVYLENFASRLCFLKDFKNDFVYEIISQIKSKLLLPQDIRPRKKIEIQQINGEPATSFELSDDFLANGFEKNGDVLELWPSGL